MSSVVDVFNSVKGMAGQVVLNAEQIYEVIKRADIQGKSLDEALDDYLKVFNLV